MATNFNTNQTRFLYVANKVSDLSGNYITAEEAEGLDPGELIMGNTDEDIFFFYKNGDGKVTRSDSIKLKNIKYVTLTSAADLDTQLKQLQIAVDSNKIDVTSSANYGKVATLIVHIRNLTSYDDADSIAVAASVTLSASTNTATKFHKAMAEALALALPKRDYDYLKVFSNGSEVTRAVAKADAATGASAGFIITQVPQKYVRGKLSNEPVGFDVEFHLHAAEEDVDWGTTTDVAGTIQAYGSIPGYFKLADLEYFALGERGDYYRGYLYPNDYTPTYMIDITGSTSYDVINIEYFYQGGAENIQKSPRLIQIATTSSYSSDLLDAIEALMAGASS